jgi:hypothetical protein
MLERREHRFYVPVPAGNSVQSDYVVPNGRTFSLEEIGASPSTNCEVRIIWDVDGTPDLLLATIRDSVQKTFKELVGDGVKKLRILLINNDLLTRSLGGYTLGGEQ